MSHDPITIDQFLAIDFRNDRTFVLVNDEIRMLAEKISSEQIASICSLASRLAALTKKTGPAL